jgi:hypothetical protein
MGVSGNNYWSGLRIPTGSHQSSGSRGNLPLNAAYSHLASGTGLAMRYQARTTAPITKIYFFLEAITGTLANITMDCKLYAEGSLVAAPGATLRATGVVTKPNAALKWIEVDFPTPYSPAAIGETLWFVLSNTSPAPTVDYPSILTTTAFAPAFNGSLSQQHYGVSSLVGYTVNGSNLTRLPHAIVQGGVTYGQPFTANVNTIFISNTQMKGFQIRPPTDIEVSGFMVTGGGASQYASFRIYDAATPPGGTPLYSYALGTDANQSRDELIGAKCWAPIVLAAGRAYNCVISYGTAAAMSGAQIEDFTSFASVFDNMRDDFVTCPGVWDIGGVWTLRTDFFPNLSLMVTGFPQTSRANFAMGI